jgi:hypothetical protein
MTFFFQFKRDKQTIYHAKNSRLQTQQIFFSDIKSFRIKKNMTWYWISIRICTIINQDHIGYTQVFSIWWQLKAIGKNPYQRPIKAVSFSPIKLNGISISRLNNAHVILTSAFSDAIDVLQQNHSQTKKHANYKNDIKHSLSCNLVAQFFASSFCRYLLPSESRWEVTINSSAWRRINHRLLKNPITRYHNGLFHKECVCFGRHFRFSCLIRLMWQNIGSFLHKTRQKCRNALKGSLQLRQAITLIINGF